METHYKHTRGRVDMTFPKHGVHESRVLIPKVAAGTVKFAFVVEEDDRLPEKAESISSRWDEQ